MNILISVEVIGVDEIPRDVFEEWEEKSKKKKKERKKRNLENKPILRSKNEEEAAREMYQENSMKEISCTQVW